MSEKEKEVKQMVKKIEPQSKATTVKPEKIDAQTAISVLIQAVELAVKRGAFNLKEASTVNEAVEVFRPAQPTAPQQVPTQQAPAAPQKSPTDEGKK